MLTGERLRAEVDPEDAYSHGFSKAPKRDSEADSAARSEYVAVDKSQLRQRAQFDMGDKYKGKKASRNDLSFPDHDDEDDHDDESEDEGESEEEEEHDNDDEPDDDESGEEEDEDDEEQEEEQPRRKVRKDDKEMLSQLRTAASSDVQKGIDVRKQIAFCDRILEARIKLQKAITAVNALPIVRLWPLSSTRARADRR